MARAQLGLHTLPVLQLSLQLWSELALRSGYAQRQPPLQLANNNHCTLAKSSHGAACCAGKLRVGAWR